MQTCHQTLCLPCINMHLQVLISTVRKSIRQDIVALMRRRATISELLAATLQRLRGTSLRLKARLSTSLLPHRDGVKSSWTEIVWASPASRRIWRIDILCCIPAAASLAPYKPSTLRASEHLERTTWIFM